ncbi:MAG TPA: SRPBCC family protein [Bryobacteraceae bacterium]
MLVRCKMAINASAETVFACVDRPEHIVQWVEGAVDHVYISERNPANPVGQRFLQKLRMGKSIKEFQGEIIAWEAPTHFGLYIPAPAYSSEAHFRISPDGPTRSTVNYSIDITLHKAIMRLLSPLLWIPLTLFVKKQIGRLKRHAEKVQADQKTN